MNKEGLKLTLAQEDIYDALYKARPRVVSTEQIGAILASRRNPHRDSNVWNVGNLVAVHIRALRQRLPKDAIETVRGVGYKLV